MSIFHLLIGNSMELLIARLVADLIFDQLPNDELIECEEATFVDVGRVRWDYHACIIEDSGHNMLDNPAHLAAYVDDAYIEHVVTAVEEGWKTVNWDVVVELVKLYLFKSYTLYCQNVAAPVN